MSTSLIDTPGKSFVELSKSSSLIDWNVSGRIVRKIYTVKAKKSKVDRTLEDSFRRIEKLKTLSSDVRRIYVSSNQRSVQSLFSEKTPSVHKAKKSVRFKENFKEVIEIEAFKQKFLQEEEMVQNISPIESVQTNVMNQSNGAEGNHKLGKGSAGKCCACIVF